MARIKIMMALLLACAATVPLSQAEDLKCGDYKDKQLCLTCLQGATCVGVTDDTAPPTPTVTCTNGEVCDVLSNTATCVALAKQDTKTCSCDKSSQCDGYQPNSVLTCGNGIPFAVTDCKDKTCMDGVCVTPTTPDPAHSTESIDDLCLAGATGWQVVKPECTTAVWCSGTKGTTSGRQDCEAGQYFDIDAGNCVTAPPVPCEGNCKGPCPDKTNCTTYYICDGKGNVQDTQTCVKDDAKKTTIYFNPETHQCDGADDTVCPSTVGCTFGLTTAASTVTTPLVTTAHATTAAPTTKPATTAAPTTKPATTAAPTTKPATTAAPTTKPATTAATTTKPATTAAPTTAAPTTAAPTTKPATCTAANVDKRYVDASDCKKYWTCDQISATTYIYTERTCMGTLVFNPVSTYCDTQANVPGCHITTVKPAAPRRRREPQPLSPKGNKRQPLPNFDDKEAFKTKPLSRIAS